MEMTPVPLKVSQWALGGSPKLWRFGPSMKLEQKKKFERKDL